ncbi:MAG: hypothetical protein ACJ72D_23270 [Marmoricola sp.]
MSTSSIPAATLRRALAATASAALLATTLAGCGKDASTPPAADDVTPTASVPVTPSTTPVPSPTRTTTPKPTRTPTAASGNGGEGGEDAPATAGGGICRDLSASAVGKVLGGTVTGAALPGTGCGFNQKNAKAPAATFVTTPYDQAAGMASAKDGATSSVEGDPEDLTGIGDAAFVVTGTAFGGDDIQAAGAVRIGSFVVNVALDQQSGLSRAKVRAMLVGLLRLAFSQAA